MALSATFTANFASFFDAVDKAQVKLEEFGGGAEEAGDRLNRMAQSFSGQKIIQEASLMAKAIGDIENVAKLTDKELARLGKTTNEAVDKMEKLGLKVPTHLQEIADKTKDANKSSTDWLGTLTKMASAIGISFSAATIINFGKALIDTAGHIDDMSKKLGVSTDAVQRWEYAAKLTGATIDNVGSAVTTMSTKLAGGGNSVEEALKRVGLQFEDIRAMTPEAAFETIAEAIRDIPDPMDQARIAMELFGKAGVELLPAIRDGMVDVGRQATIMSADTIAAFDLMSNTWDSFSQYFMATVAERLTKPFREAKLEWQVFTGQIAKFPQMGTPKAFIQTADAVGLTGDALEDAARKQDKMNTETGRAVDATVKLSAEITAHNTLWENRIILAEAMEYWNRQVERAEDDRRLGFFQTLPILTEVTAAEQANAAALIQRGDQILALTDYNEAYNATLVDQAYQASVAAAEAEKSISTYSSLGAAISDSVLKAIQGGGNLFQAAGSTIGNFLLDPKQSGIGKAIEGAAKKLPGFLGGAISAAIPAVGAFIGPAIGWLSDKITGWFGKKEHEKLRDSFVTAAGGIDELRKAAAAAGLSLTELFAAKKTDQVEAAIKRIQDGFDFQASAIDAAIDAAQRYGFTLEELGPALQRQELDEQAQQLYKDWEVLNSAGIDTIAITERMGDAVSAYVQDAIAMGTEVPAAMRPMLEKFVEAGTLLDADGDAITDLEDAGVDFTLTMSDGFKALIDEVHRLTDAISRGLGTAIENVPDVKVKGSIDWNATPPEMPGYKSLGPGMGYVQLQQGTHGFRNFGSGTPAMLHGWEAVVPRDDANATVHGSLGGTPAAAATSVVINAQGAFFDTPGDLQRLADRVNDALTAKFGMRNAMRAG
jgi:hypothetical protein